ncbi:MAG: glycosyltransferase family 4 protein [Thermoleophilia bacterium]
MRVAVVHGYFLGDSGSAIYARELAREFTQQGHDVTLVCQDQSADRYDFIDSLHEFGPDNAGLRTVFERAPVYEGRCRMVRPFIGDRLLTYVAGPFPPFDAVPFQEATSEMITAYVEANIRDMTGIFRHWPQDLVQANHAVMQPYLVNKALRDGTPYVVTIHGSELNFTVRKDRRMAPYMQEGLAGATAIAALSETSHGEVVGLAREHGLDITSRTVILPPGVDTELFAPLDSREKALSGISKAIDPDLDDIAVFAGRLLWTKGLQYVVAALPLILQERPRIQLVVVGDGPMRKPLEQLISLLESGNLEEARRLTETETELKPAPEYGPVIPGLGVEEEKIYQVSALGDLSRRIHFTGHLSHKQLAPLFAAADVSLAPSVFPEAFGLVSIEALAAGALPIATYQTGLRSPLDVIAAGLDDARFRQLAPGTDLTTGLASALTGIFGKYQTRDREFREKLHGIARENFSWRIVAGRYLEWSRSQAPPA